MVKEEVVTTSKVVVFNQMITGEDTNRETGISHLIRGDSETTDPVITPLLISKEVLAIREVGEIKIRVTTTRVTSGVKAMDRDIRGLKEISMEESVVETGIRDNNSSMKVVTEGTNHGQRADKSMEVVAMEETKTEQLSTKGTGQVHQDLRKVNMFKQVKGVNHQTLLKGQSLKPLHQSKL